MSTSSTRPRRAATACVTASAVAMMISACGSSGGSSGATAEGKTYAQAHKADYTSYLSTQNLPDISTSAVLWCTTVTPYSEDTNPTAYDDWTSACAKQLSK